MKWFDEVLPHFVTVEVDYTTKKKFMTIYSEKDNTELNIDINSSSHTILDFSTLKRYYTNGTYRRNQFITNTAIEKLYLKIVVG